MKYTSETLIPTMHYDLLNPSSSQTMKFVGRGTVPATGFRPYEGPQP